MSAGTIVSGRKSLEGYPVKAIAVLPRQAVVTVAGKGMIGVHGVGRQDFRRRRCGGPVGVDDLPGLV